MKIGTSELFKRLMLGHLVLFALIGIIGAVSCLLGGTLTAASELQLPLGFSCRPPAEQMTGCQGAVFAMVVFPLTGFLMGLAAWIFTRTGLWLLSRVPKIDVE